MNHPVENQLRAFNTRDLDAFMAAYADDARFENGAGEEILAGADEMRAFYGTLFENSPNLHCDVVNRMTVGEWIIDEEEIRGVHAERFPEEIHAAVAYRVEDGVITFVRMFM